MSYRNPPVVIIGAGVGGLTLALLLRQRGIAAEVLEQSAELREVGAAVALAANATRCSGTWAWATDLARVSTEPTRLIHRDGRDGHTVRPAGTTAGTARRSARRSSACTGWPCSACWPARSARSTCTSAAASRRWKRPARACGCAARPGTVFEASVVVGADGVHSGRQDWVTGGDEPVYSGTSGFRGLVPAERLPQPARSRRAAVLDGARARTCCITRSTAAASINFLAVIDGPPRWTAPAWLEEAAPGAHLAPFAGWHPAVTEMLAAVPQSPRWGLFARRPLARWSRGPVVLLGDAAHAMLPHQGRAPTRRSRTPPCWPPNWTAPPAVPPTFPPRCAATPPGAGSGPARSS